VNGNPLSSNKQHIVSHLEKISSKAITFTLHNIYSSDITQHLAFWTDKRQVEVNVEINLKTFSLLGFSVFCRSRQKNVNPKRQKLTKLTNIPYNALRKFQQRRISFLSFSLPRYIVSVMKKTLYMHLFRARRKNEALTKKSKSEKEQN
jgi:hypothetical protein